jgi:hypothetical protein
MHRHLTLPSACNLQGVISAVFSPLPAFKIFRIGKKETHMTLRSRWQHIGLSCLVGILSGCGPDAVHKSHVENDPSKDIVVKCSMTTMSGAPCASEARQACNGDARLRTIQSQSEIPVTVGVDQHAAPIYQYQVVYMCVDKA